METMAYSSEEEVARIEACLAEAFAKLELEKEEGLVAVSEQDEEAFLQDLPLVVDLPFEHLLASLEDQSLLEFLEVDTAEAAMVEAN